MKLVKLLKPVYLPLWFSFIKNIYGIKLTSHKQYSWERYHKTKILLLPHRRSLRDNEVNGLFNDTVLMMNILIIIINSATMEENISVSV